MEPTDLTIKILQEIRDDNRGLRADMNAGFAQVDARFAQSDARFLAIETTLKDLAGQMVMLARGIKTALETRTSVERRLDEYEKRLQAVEDRDPH